MKRIYVLYSIVLLLGNIVLGQELKKIGPFEGTIQFIQYLGSDTSYYSYDIKDNNIRILNTDIKTNNDEGIYLINLTTKTTTAISPVRRIYKDEPSPAPVKPDGQIKVTKTNNVKTINGYKCTEYIVENATDGIKVTYWIASGNFDFFLPMMNILNRKDVFSEYYMQIENTKGMFPMEAYETDLSDNPKGFMKATRITPKIVATGIFEIPAGYNKFQK
ncbi:MAG: DUF4412 domain-containing protein [Bacteroidia bacterium]